MHRHFCSATTVVALYRVQYKLEKGVHQTGTDNKTFVTFEAQTYGFEHLKELFHKSVNEVLAEQIKVMVPIPLSFLKDSDHVK